MQSLIYMFELINKIYNASPQWLYVVLLLLFFIAAIVIFTRNGVIRIQLKRMLGVMFAEYLVLLLSFTVFYREMSTLWSVRLIPFQNYYNNDRMDLIMQDALLNVAMFIPVGFCSSVFLRYPKWLKIILLSATLSCSIEITQYILSKGECDVTDVINNSIGGLFGYWVYWLWKKYELWRR